MVPEIFAFLGTDTARPDFEITTFKCASTQEFDREVCLEISNARIVFEVHDSMPKSMFASLGIYNGDLIAVGGSDAHKALTDMHTLALNLDKVRAKKSRERIAKCEVCNRSSFEVKLYNCSGCKRVSYCSRVHQKQDWKRHKHRCGILR